MINAHVAKKRLVPLAATFAAIYGTLRLVPFSLWIGAPGRMFTATEFFAPLFGIMLGPYIGGVASVIGSFIAIILTGRTNFFGLDFLPVLVNTLALGFLIRRRWALSFLLYSVSLIVFFVHPMTLHFVTVPLGNGKVEIPFVWVHIIAWMLLASPLSRRSIDWLSDATALKATLAACVLTLVGTTAQHLTGTILFATLAVPFMGISPETLRATWSAVFYVYPLERIVVLAASTIVTTAVTKALVASGLLHATGHVILPMNRRGSKTAS